MNDDRLARGGVHGAVWTSEDARHQKTTARPVAPSTPLMIELYLIRHGVAEERGEAWPDDGKRPLTPKGMAKLRSAVRGLVRLGVTFDVISRARSFGPDRRRKSSPGDRVASTHHPARVADAGGQYRGGPDRSREVCQARADRDRRSRAGDWRAGRAPRGLAPCDPVQEGRDLPHRRRGAPRAR